MGKGWRLDPKVVERLHRQAQAARWGLGIEPFAAALERSACRHFGDQAPDRGPLERYLGTLHVADLALACACAAGSDAAWEHFVREHRPGLYRAADAIDVSGGARELADSLYGELFGLHTHEGVRRSHFDYYHGRSTLGTWLRAVLSQRYVDRYRSRRSLEPLPDDEAVNAIAAAPQSVDPRWPGALERMRVALTTAVAGLSARDRLRLACYHAQSMTLAEVGHMLGEHEATVSRHLSRTRRALKVEIERQLRERERMTQAQIGECFALVVADTGSLDVAELLGGDEDRKETTPTRSTR